MKLLIRLKKHLKLKSATWQDERCASMRFIARCYSKLGKINESRIWCDKAINDTPLAYTVVGRATGTTEITGMYIITTTVINSVLTVRNPAGNATALTITPNAGGASAVSAHLVITQII